MTKNILWSAEEDLDKKEAVEYLIGFRDWVMRQDLYLREFKVSEEGSHYNRVVEKTVNINKVFKFRRTIINSLDRAIEKVKDITARDD